MKKSDLKNNHEKNKRGSGLEPLLHSEHIVLIEKLVVGGAGLARISFQQKSLVVFVNFAAPDEKIKIKIIFIEKNHLVGKIIEILTPSPARRKAPCKYFGDCGGCNWQHIVEVEQLRQKNKILTDLLAKFIPQAQYQLMSSVPSENNFNYRNRIQLKQLGKALGYFKKDSHQVVDIESCLIAEQTISDQIPKIKSKLSPTTEIRKIELKTNHLNQFESYSIGADGEGLSFSQVNNSVNEKLVHSVTKLVKDRNPQFLTELYAGAGNFTFPLLSALPNLRIESVELNTKLTAFSTKKLTELHLQKRLFAFSSDCESFTERRPLSKELVLLDPPRSGCSDSVLNKIIQTAPLNMLYISCHPVFLARDLKKIMQSEPEYKITYLQIFDMFPQTDHFETLMLLSK